MAATPARALLALFAALLPAAAPQCVVSTIGARANGFADGNATAAAFSAPKMTAVNESTGDVFVADEGNARIRVIFANRSVGTLAGAGSGTSDGVGAFARFQTPVGVALDAAEPWVLYIADYTACTLRRLTVAPGYIATSNTVAGAAGTCGSADGAATTTARINNPFSLAAHGGTVYFADAQDRLRRLAAGGVSSFGSGLAGATDGRCDVAAISPRGVGLDPANPLLVYVTDDRAHRVRLVSFAGGGCEVSTIAGSGAGAWADGTGTQASFWVPLGVAAAHGRLFVTDNFGSRIRRVELATGAVTTLAGAGFGYKTGSNSAGVGIDGVGTLASFNNPRHASVFANGSLLYVAEASGGAVRVVSCAPTSASPTPTPGASASRTRTPSPSPTPTVTPSRSASPAPPSASGTPSASASPGGCLVTTLAGVAGRAGAANGALGAGLLANATAVAVNASGAVFVLEGGGHRIRFYSPATGQLSNFSGRGAAGFLSGGAAAAAFRSPTGLALSPNGATLFVADAGNCAIRVVAALTGFVGTAAGSGACGFRNGPAAVATFSAPQAVSVALGPGGLGGNGATVFIADAGNNALRMLRLGVVSTLAGSPAAGYVDATGLWARFSAPRGVLVDAAGATVYVADGSLTIRKVDVRTGLTSTLCGGGSAGFATAPARFAQFFFANNASVQLAWDRATGGLLVPDGGALRLVSLDGVVSTLAGGPPAPTADGWGSLAAFDGAAGVAVGAGGAYLVAEARGCVLRRVACAPSATPAAAPAPSPTPTPAPAPNTCVVTTIAGGAQCGTAVDGVGSAAAFIRPTGVATAPGGIVYVVGLDHAIRAVAVATGAVTTLAGSLGSSGFVSGAAAAARFNYPTNIGLDMMGNIFVAVRPCASASPRPQSRAGATNKLPPPPPPTINRTTIITPFAS